MSTPLSEGPRVAEFHQWQSLAMRDVEATGSVAFRRTANFFLATLTLFAIALYMLGPALVMGRHRSAYVLAAAGTIFAVGGVGLYAAPSLSRASGRAHGFRRQAIAPLKCPICRGSLPNRGRARRTTTPSA